MTSPLAVEFEPDARPATGILHLRGRAGYREAADLRRALFEAIERSEGKNLVVELQELDSIDTAAMAVLVEGLMATHDRDPDIYLVCPSEAVRKVFHLVGLDDALTRCYHCLADLEQAVAV